MLALLLLLLLLLILPLLLLPLLLLPLLLLPLPQAQYLFDESIQVCKFASIASKVTVEAAQKVQPKPKRDKVGFLSTHLQLLQLLLRSPDSPA